jgi:hypothetical protein
MEDWRSKALTSFPELEDEITRNQGGPIGLWTDLHFALTAAYRAAPINDDLIRRIYDFAVWCFRQPKTGDAETDLSSAAAVGFIESLPLDQRVSDDLDAKACFVITCPKRSTASCTATLFGTRRASLAHHSYDRVLRAI